MKLRYETHIRCPRERVFAWHDSQDALRRLSPPWRQVTLKKHEGLADGSKAVMRVSTGPINSKWVARHEDVRPPETFTDVQTTGPFKAWRHTHRFEEKGSDTRLIDEIELKPPRKLALVGGGETWIRREVDRLFAYRHKITRADCEAHCRLNPHDRKLRIAVTGGSGFIGSALVPFLRAGGHEVLIITRSPDPKNPNHVGWSPSMGSIDEARLEGLDAVIHLAGESVIGPWTESKRMSIYGSRVHGTTLLCDALARLDQPPRVLISASASGIYGDRGAEILTENAPAGETGFLSYVTRDWERATAAAETAGIRVVHPRIGLVLNPAGGALGLALPLFKLGLGGRVTGRDIWLSWIALNDLVHALWHLLWADVFGPVNVVSPMPVTLSDFTKTIGRVIRRPAPFAISERWARLLGGTSLSESALLSQRIHPERLGRSGYSFLFTDLESALRFQLGKNLPEKHAVATDEEA